MDIKEDLLLWFTNFLIKKRQLAVINMNANNEKLAEDLHKPIIKTF